jgi:hypothetical protein
MKDYFNHITETPKEVQAILAKMEKEHTRKDGLDYSDLNRYVNELESCGWTFDYYLDAVPFELSSIADRIKYAKEQAIKSEDHQMREYWKGEYQRLSKLQTPQV